MAASRIEVIGLVTSAGGLEALTAVLRVLPADFPAAIVVGQHLGGAGSQLPAILGRRVALPVAWARDGEHIAYGAVTICPPRALMEVLPDGTCAVHQGLPLGRRTLDELLRSLADSFGPAAAGVVLTGMGDDGARGARALHEAGGLVVAQSEDTAEHPSMPRAAVEADAAGLVLPLHRIGAVLLDAALGRELPREPTELDAIRTAFGDAGEVGRIAGEVDWSRTLAGPVQRWPPLLRTQVRLTMDALHPCGLYWGPEYVFFFNDAAVPSLGGRHAEALGRPAAVAFPENADTIGPQLNRVLAGVSELDRGVLIPIMRNGRLRDFWYDLSYTPVRAVDGAVAGIRLDFLPRTQETLASRRQQALNRLATVPVSPGARIALEQTVAVLAEVEDVSFAVAYLLDAAGTHAQLAASTGVEAGGAMAPLRLRAADPTTWPLRQALEAGQVALVGDLGERFRGHTVGPARITPEHAVVHPLGSAAAGDTLGALVLGASPRVSFDDDYRQFLELAGETVAAKVAESRARGRERVRLERLAELDRAKTEFFSNVSHEFRTPLTLLIGPLEEMLRNPAPDNRQDLELMARNAHRLQRLVATLLDFSQLEAGRLRARFVPTDLAELTRDIAAQFETAARRAGLGLRVGLEAIGEPVWVDREMWENVLSNLLSNALKFTFAGEIEVTLRRLPQHAELVVRDTGVGIPADEVPYIFERFHRVRGTRARTEEGAGIGLAFVHELVRRHHGRIRATSVPGEGTRFTVWIPLGRRSAAADGDQTGAAPAGLTMAAAMAEEADHWNGARPDGAFQDADLAEGDLRLRRNLPHARVLVVDDNKDMRDYLERLLNPYWTVQLAADGAEALALCRHDPPDLVLSDVMMPGADGLGLLAALRADDALARVPVVFVTARAGEEDGIAGVLAGAEDYVVKPFSGRELVARVGVQLELTRLRRRQGEVDAFRVVLADTLRGIEDPAEVPARAAELIGRHLGAGRAYYQEFDRAAGTCTIHRDYADGLPSLAGTYRLADRDDALVEESHRTGRPLVVRDTARLEPQAAASWAASVRAGVAAPTMRAGVCVAALAVTSAEPRDWTDAEVALVEEAAERIWSAVDRVRAERELRRSEERFRTVADAVPALIWHNDAEGHTVFVNRSFRDHTGLTDAEIGREPWQALLHPDEADACLAGYLRAVRDRGPWHGRARLRGHDGAWRTFDHYASPLTGGNGTYQGHVGVSVDVSAETDAGVSPT